MHSAGTRRMCTIPQTLSLSVRMKGTRLVIIIVVHSYRCLNQIYETTLYLDSMMWSRSSFNTVRVCLNYEIESSRGAMVSQSLQEKA
jgi:hypothetical protein